MLWGKNIHMTIDVTYLSPAGENHHQEQNHKFSPHVHSILCNLWYNKRVFAAMYLFVLLGTLCATPTHSTLKLSLTVLLPFMFSALKGIDVAACSGELMAKLSLFLLREDSEGH